MTISTSAPQCDSYRPLSVGMSSRIADHWSNHRFYTLCESSFSLGRFFDLLAQWEDDSNRPQQLHYIAFVSLGEDDGSLNRPHNVTDEVWYQFTIQKPVAVPGFHRLSFANECVTLTLINEPREAICSKMTMGWDALIWQESSSDDFLRSLLRLSNAKAVVLSEAFTDSEKAVLKRSAFRSEMQSGYESAVLLAPRKKGGYRQTDDRDVLVIGAGLAGANAAYALAKAGWRVRVIDEAPVPGARASALAWGILHPHFSRDDNILSRLSREGFFATRGLLKALEAKTGEVLFSDSGCLQMAHSDAIWDEWSLAKAKSIPFALPEDYAEFVSCDKADQLTGVSLKRGGWWFKQAGMVRAGAFCRALIAESRVPYLGSTMVAHLQKEGTDWVAIGEFGQPIARASHVVVACATSTDQVLGMKHLCLDALRGRITLLRDTDLSTLKAPVSGEGYISNLPDGFCGVGATYENERLGAWQEDEAHLANLDKLGTILREPVDVVVTGAYQGVRAVGLGRLPYVGPVCDEKAWIEAVQRDARMADMEHPPVIDGLWIMAGMGSRGVSMSTLCARILVSQMDGTPMPIDNRVVRCLVSSRSVKKYLETI